ncbi:hypothetical protein O181_032972 [Austropuccinia psidii MF-1]|uniref:Uncharacterized protein n=1 Tax=Austropuccinia psidii MF-1 TaxID=1389203 RepID=A0A9Q3H6Q8_9BASI|nr:hypothetical protein [Austropuccinia psidii MF-1]
MFEIFNKFFKKKISKSKNLSSKNFSSSATSLNSSKSSTNSNLLSSKSNLISSSSITINSISNDHQSSSQQFILPDSIDIRPYIQSNNQPISIKQLLTRISQEYPIESINDSHCLDQKSNHLEITLPSSCDQANQANLISSKRKLSENLGPSIQLSPAKKRKTSINSSSLSFKNSFTHLNSHCIDIIHNLPPNVWYKIFLYHDLQNLQSFLPVDPSHSNSILSQPTKDLKSISHNLSLALKAQKHRHSLILLSKDLEPIARKAAWNTVILTSLKMIDKVAKKLEADPQLSNNLQNCFIIFTPPDSIATPNKRSIHSISSSMEHHSKKPHLQIKSSQNFTPNKKNPNSNAKPSLNHPRRSSIHQKPLIHSNFNKKTEIFQAVVIPPSPLSSQVQTTLNTKFNSISSTHSTTPSSISQAPWEEIQIEEEIYSSSLPSLLLSIARSLKLFHVIGPEKLATRTLKSLSVLSSLLGGLAEIFIDGGGNTYDLFALIDGLRLIRTRNNGAALKFVSITGPSWSLSPGLIPNPSNSLNPFKLNPSQSNCSHLSVEHLILGPGLPLSPEELYWLIHSTTGPSSELKALKITLKESTIVTDLKSSVNSSNSAISNNTRRRLSSRAYLGQAFERIGSSLIQLGISEDWNSPLSSSIQRRVKFEGDPGGGLLDEALIFCNRLELISLAACSLYSAQLLSVLPFTLKEIEIRDGVVTENDCLMGFNFDDIWKARSQAALFGLEKIRICLGNNGNKAQFMKHWKRTGLNGLEKLQRAGISNSFQLDLFVKSQNKSVKL